MTLQEFMNIGCDRDIDTYDTKWDVIVTICRIDDEGFKDAIKNDTDPDYYRFCRFVYTHVHFVKMISEYEALCEWTEFVDTYREVLRNFAEKYWYSMPTSDEGFELEWIKELHSYLAGNISNDMYKELTDALDSQFCV